MKFQVANEEVFASTGGRPFDKNKPLIIFIHGSGLTHMCWVLQTRYFAFHGYSVLALDLPGHGLSGGKSLSSIEEMADWVNAVIDAVGHKEASLVGHSQGCLQILEYAFKYKDRINKAVFVGGSNKMPVHPDLINLANNQSIPIKVVGEFTNDIVQIGEHVTSIKELNSLYKNSFEANFN